MSKQPENFFIALNLPLNFIFNLRLHLSKFLRCGFHSQLCTAYLDKLFSCFFDFANAEQLARRIGHESCEAGEEDDAPGDLEAEGQAPLGASVGCVAAGETDPVGYLFVGVG